MVVSGTDSEQPIKVESPKANKMGLTFFSMTKTLVDCRIAKPTGTDFGETLHESNWPEPGVPGRLLSTSACLHYASSRHLRWDEVVLWRNRLLSGLRGSIK